jgi:murein L,D-transpeptidase YcbB/YkuD
MRKLAIFTLLLMNVAAAWALSPVEDALRQQTEAIQEGTGGVIADQHVAAVTLLPAFYAQRAFGLLWNDDADFQALVKILHSATGHGLDPEDYHYRTLSAWPTGESDPHRLAARDILATDALIRLGYHLYFGKVDPSGLDPDWNLSRRLRNEEPIAVLERALSAPSLAEFLNTELAPSGTFYIGLRAALAHYRTIAAAGGWPAVPDGPTLKPGMHGDRIAALRSRLAATDPALQSQATDPALFDPELIAAVERFQKRHGLMPDGAVGKRTLDALNVPVESRIDQLRVNLERTRWLFHDRVNRFLIVNIAGFQAYLYADDKIIWESRVQVGKPFRKTPVFKSMLSYLVLNPTWTVPPTILRQDIIPRLRKDPGYLARNNMVLLDRSGQHVDTARIDFGNLSVNNFPYTVRQEPGPKNALGRMKFMFPNEHSVYLHDTPSRALFTQADRAFSSGCIRVEQPLSLATTLLNDSVNWSQTKIEEQLSDATTQTVNLDTPVPVYLMYWTAEPDTDGKARFFTDVYARDQAVLDGLRAPFRFDPPR